MPTPAEIVAESLKAANTAKIAALEKMQTPPWLPSFLAFDLDGDKIPDLLEPHLWSDAMNMLLWAILTFASPNTIAFKAATKISKLRDSLPK